MWGRIKWNHSPLFPQVTVRGTSGEGVGKRGRVN
jgi:hypothetical protein